MFYKTFLFISAVAVVLSASSIRNKRQAGQPYILSDGVTEYLGNVNPSFACSAPGYYADVDNNCQIFHVCINQEFPDGKTEIAQYSFACPNQTVFSQFSLTCAHPEEALPCASSPDFFYLNERTLDPKALLHEDADVEKFGSYFSKQ